MREASRGGTSNKHGLHVFFVYGCIESNQDFGKAESEGDRGGGEKCTMLTDFDVVKEELKKRLRSGEDLCFYRGSKLLTVRNFRLVTADFFSGEYRGGNCQVKGCCSFEYKQGDGWSYEGENSVYEVILQIDGDTIISIGNNRINVL